jgi:hypothetical protein
MITTIYKDTTITNEMNKHLLDLDTSEAIIELNLFDFAGIKEIDQDCIHNNTHNSKPKLEVPQERCATSRGLLKDNAQLQERPNNERKPPMGTSAQLKRKDKT